MSHSLSSSETNSSLKASSSTVGGAGDILGLATSAAEANNNSNNNNGSGSHLIGGINGINSSTNTNSNLTSTTTKANTTAKGGHLPFSISLVQECSATKKGVLWEQQQNRFFFNRWKERFFILTTDYLTCFKKGSKKHVGMSEMGSFVYKINLNEVKALTWVDKKKNGVIGVQLANTALFLWNDSERLLDDWMASLQESTSRTKVRREALRKSATLLTTPSLLLTSSPTSRLSSKDINLIERKNSPNLFFNHRVHTPTSDHHQQDSSALFDHHQLGNGNADHQEETPPPPPPPPRRYMRCFSTDIATLADHNNRKQLMTNSPREGGSRLGQQQQRQQQQKPSQQTPPPVPPHHNSTFNHKKINGNGNTISNGVHEINASNQQRKLSSASSVQHSLQQHSSSSSSGPPIASQSLRCKSSYALQLSPLMIGSSGSSAKNNGLSNGFNTNSPTLFAQHQQRRAAAKRLSTISGGGGHLHYATNGHHQYPPRPQSQTIFFSALAASSGDRADSDFTFIPSKSISIKPSLSASNHLESTVPRHTNSSCSNSSSFSTVSSSAPKKNSGAAHLLPQQGPHRNMLTSSASLVLNSRRRQQYQQQLQQQNSWAELERKTSLATPPPVPPHRTHLHHF